MDGDALRLAQQELDEIDWAHGVAPMPQHLVERGTTRCEYRRGIRLAERIVIRHHHTDDAPEFATFEEYDLPEPFYEVRVWGELIKRGPL